MEVTAPNGRTWKVRRRWFPRLRKFRRGKTQLDGLDGLGDVAWLDGDTPVALVVGIVAVLLLVLLAPVVLPTLLFVLQIVLLVVIVPAYLVLRLVLRRPWVIEATSSGPPEESMRWGVVGLRASGAAREEIAIALAAGIPPGPTVGTRLA
jgi:hypothetical protein